VRIEIVNSFLDIAFDTLFIVKHQKICMNIITCVIKFTFAKCKMKYKLGTKHELTLITLGDTLKLVSS